MPRFQSIFMFAVLTASAGTHAIAATADFAQIPAEAVYCTSAPNWVSGYASNGSTAMYVSTYEAVGWSGEIHSNLLNQGDDSTKPNSDWGLPPKRSTADKLDALASIDQRQILTHDGARGVPFRWEALSQSQQALLQPLPSQASTKGGGSDLIGYLRGDRSLESTATTTGFRARKSRQGDIVHSHMWLVGKPAAGQADKSYRDFTVGQAARVPMLYAGGNDGMLHGFSARTGEELIAYVPRGAYPHLALLAAHDYRHHAFVDGSPFTGDALIGSQWKTFLVASMGAGGSGFFVLDVTAPDRFTESGAADIVVMDRTDGGDPDLGHIFAAPTVDEANAQYALQITRLNNGRWAVVLGNGFGSANGLLVLLIQYLDGARELLKIAATSSVTGSSSGISNGLAAPQFLDVNSDGIPDLVYAGDLQGHLWKFDLAAASDQRWKLALNGSPLFTALRNGVSQAITVAPVLRVHPDVGGLMVAFGTGQELTEADNTDSSAQTVYSVMDYTRYRIEDSGADKGKVAVDATRTELPTAAASRAELMAQSVPPKLVATGNDRSFWQLQGTPFSYCQRTPCAADERKGWYLDLPTARERLLDPLSFFGGGDVLEIISRVPANATPAENCGLSFRTLLDIITGMPQKSRILDTNGDGQVTVEDAFASRATAAQQELRFPSSGGGQMRQGSDGKADRLQALRVRVVRPSWRQLK